MSSPAGRPGTEGTARPQEICAIERPPPPRQVRSTTYWLRARALGADPLWANLHVDLDPPAWLRRWREAIASHLRAEAARHNGFGERVSVLDLTVRTDARHQIEGRQLALRRTARAGAHAARS